MKTVKNLLTAIMMGSAATIAIPSIAMPSPDVAYKVSDQALTLDIHFQTKNYVYDNQWPVEKEAARLTNMHLNNIASMANIKTKQTFILMLAAHDLPPILGGESIRDKVNRYGPEGAFIPMNDLIDKYAPHIKAYFEQHPDIKNAISSSDGQLYYIPYLPDGDLGRGYFIRTDWLKKLNLKVPQNIDELYNVLVAFRNQDPNGNGKKDEMPIFMRNWQELIRMVTFWDGRSTGSEKYHDFYINDNGELRYAYIEAGYKNGIRHLAKWYKEDLIDPEIFTRGDRSREFLLANNLGGMTHDWFASTASYNDSIAKQVPGFEFKAMAPPASISGKRIEEHRRATVSDDGWAMSFSNKNPIETIKYFDFFFTKTGRNLANYGVEGKQYDLIDGKPIFKQSIIKSNKPLTLQLREVGAQIPRGFQQDYNYELQQPNQYALEYTKLYSQKVYFPKPFLGVELTDQEQKIYDKYWPSILGYMLEMQQSWILGYGDIDKDWDGYLSKLDKMGVQTIMALMQNAYDRTYNR